MAATIKPVIISYMTNAPLTATCHCGAVSIRVAVKPEYINECNCSLCSKHGVWWGYYPVADVTVSGATTGYSRTDRTDQAVCLHFCGSCGCTTHWTLTSAFAAQHPEEANRMGVNMRLFARDALAGVELRFPDGRAWEGDGTFGYVRAADVIGA